MVGQSKLVEKFNSFTMSNLPHSIILEGKYGCGKHTLVNMLAERLCLEVENISKKLSYEDIVSFYLSATPKIYLVDIELDERQQNSLLKFLEEPGSYSYIIILCENKNYLLETIQNRCISFKFEEYTKEELKSFVGDSNFDLLDVCDTPGKCISISKSNVYDLKNLCNAVINKIDIANIPNALSISNKFNFGKEDDKLDVFIFIDLLLKEIAERVKVSREPKFINAYVSILNTKKKLKIQSIDKKKIFELGLLDLKKNLK